MDATTVLIIVGAFVLIGGLCAWGLHMGKRRTADLQAEAERLGLDFHPRGALRQAQGVVSRSNHGDLSVAAMSGLELFSRGYGKRITNALTGRMGERGLAVFDCAYTVGHGKNRSTHSQSVAMLDVSALALRAFLVKPESIFHKIGSAFGYQDIDFPVHPIFSKQYLLRGSDEQAVRLAFGENVLTYLDMHKGLSLETDGARLIFYRPSKRVSVGAVRGFIDDAEEAAALFTRQGQAGM